jgi:hypothetical protein
MSFEVEKSGKIMESKYFEDKFTEETVTLLSGIIQAFVVDQDSPFDVESECKKTRKGSTECTKNSKNKEGKKTVFKKYAENQENLPDSEETLEHTTKTWINQEGKIEKSQIQGKFAKKYKSEEGEETMEFDLKADVIIVTSEKLTADQIQELNKINKLLPEVKSEHECKKKTEINELDEEENNSSETDLPESLSSPSQLGRMLTEDHEGRSLFDNTITYKYFSLYDIPFNLNSRMYSGYDNNYKYWVCGIHRFVFSSIEMKILNTDFCISSHGVQKLSRTKVSKWAQKGKLKAYIITVKFSIFTVGLYGEVAVDNTPYIESYYNTYGNTVTKMNIVASISVSVTGEASVGVAKGGITFTTKMASNINDYMVGYTSPFAAYLYLDKSIEGQFQVWVKYLTVSKTCYTIFGIKICLPDIKYSDKVSLYKETYAYQYYPEVQLFTSSF